METVYQSSEQIEKLFKQQAEVMNHLKLLARARGVEVEFDISDPFSPIANFTGGSEQQITELAIEIEAQFGRITV